LFEENTVLNKLNLVLETLGEIESSVEKNDKIPEVKKEAERLTKIIKDGLKVILKYFDK